MLVPKQASLFPWVFPELDANTSIPRQKPASQALHIQGTPPGPIPPNLVVSVVQGNSIWHCTFELENPPVLRCKFLNSSVEPQGRADFFGSEMVSKIVAERKQFHMFRLLESPGRPLLRYHLCFWCSDWSPWRKLSFLLDYLWPILFADSHCS